jgi:hypothetical protein
VSASLGANTKPSRRTRSYSSSVKKEYFNVFSDEGEVAGTHEDLAHGTHLELGDWNLPPTMQADFNQHQPTGMFSDAQSTIPDNTLNARLIAEQAKSDVAPIFCAPPNEALQSSKSSLPWSEIINAQREEGLLPEEGNDSVMIDEPIAPPETREDQCEEKLPVEEPGVQPDLPKPPESINPLDNGTYSPPGTPVHPSHNSQPSTKRKSSGRKSSKATKAKTKKKKKANQKDGQHSEDELAITNQDLQLKLPSALEAANAASSSDTKRISVARGEYNDLQGSAEEPLNVAFNLPISEVKVVITATKKNLTGSDESAAKHLPDTGGNSPGKIELAEAPSEIIAAVEACVVKPQPKRGRGRPRKDQKAQDTVLMAKASSLDKKVELKFLKDELKDEIHPLQEMSVNATTLETPETQGGSKKLDGDEPKPPVAENDENVPVKSIAVTKPSPKVSSLLSGKRHRVGLSKRVTIAPLLRSVRK